MGELKHATSLSLTGRACASHKNQELNFSGI